MISCLFSLLLIRNCIVCIKFCFLQVLTSVNKKASLKIYLNENNTNSIVDPEDFIIVEFMLFGL